MWVRGVRGDIFFGVRDIVFFGCGRCLSRKCLGRAVTVVAAAAAAVVFCTCCLVLFQ